MNKRENQDVSPGEQLKSILEVIYPFNEENSSFASKIDNALMAEGSFAKLLYDSSINYTLRRLINTSVFLKRKYDSNNYPYGTFESELRKFLKENTRIPEKYRGKIFVLILECIKLRDREVNSTTKKKLLSNAKKNNLRCYICGCSLNFTEKESLDSAEVEHIWPRAMGGNSDSNNLVISCLRCNKIKSDYIDYSDFHYEEISLSVDKNDQHFLTKLKWDYRIPLWLKSQCSCVICKKTASTEGELRLARRDLSDSWHFMNIEAYCSQHEPE